MPHGSLYPIVVGPPTHAIRDLARTTQADGAAPTAGKVTAPRTYRHSTEEVCVQSLRGAFHSPLPKIGLLIAVVIWGCGLDDVSYVQPADLIGAWTRLDSIVGGDTLRTAMLLDSDGSYVYSEEVLRETEERYREAGTWAVSDEFADPDGLVSPTDDSLLRLTVLESSDRSHVGVVDYVPFRLFSVDGTPILQLLLPEERTMDLLKSR